MNILLFLIYGKNRVYHLELTYSVLSAARFLKGDPSDIRIILATDAENRRPDLPVEHLLITPEMLDEWQMGGTYNHAIKVYALDHVLREFEAPAILVDSDTVMRAHPKRLFERIGPNKSLMHARECPLADTPEWPEWQALINATGGSVGGQSITAQSVMCNSGVLGLDPKDAHLMDNVKAVMRDIRAHSTVFTAEQLAAGLVLNAQTEVCTCEDLVEHYWDGPRAYYQYQMKRMFPEVLNGGGVPQEDWQIAPLDDALTGSWGNRIAAKIKKMQRRADPEYAHAYMAYRSALSLRRSDPELANVWAVTALGMLRWGLAAQRPEAALRDFAQFGTASIDAQVWMQPELRDRWRAYWSDTKTCRAANPSQ